MKKTLLVSILITFSFLFKSQSYAQWQQLSSTNGWVVWSLATSGSNIFAGSSSMNRSTNNGTNWTSVGLSSVGPIIISSSEIYTGTNNGVYLSTNNGTNWASLGLNKVTGLAKSGSNIFAGTRGYGLYISTNNGSNWTIMTNGLTNSREGYSFAINGTNIFAGTDNGVYFSTNNGSNWVSKSNNMPIRFGLYPKINALALNGSNIVAGTWQFGVFLSTNNGSTWTALNNGIPDTSTVHTVAISGNHIFAAIEYGGVFESTIAGNSWTSMNQGMPVNADAIIYASSLTNNYMYVGTWGLGIWKRPLYQLGIGINENEEPSSMIKVQCYPNPINQQTAISYKLQAKSFVQISIYDLTGREIETLVNEEKEKGDYKITYNAQNLKSGIYLVKLNSDKELRVTKFVKE